jgi:hypothetical protein
MKNQKISSKTTSSASKKNKCKNAKNLDLIQIKKTKINIHTLPLISNKNGRNTIKVIEKDHHLREMTTNCH